MTPSKQTEAAKSGTAATEPRAFPIPTHITSLGKLRRARDRASEDLPVQIRADVHERFTELSDQMQLPADLLATLALEAFTNLVDEDHSLQLPIMLQFVD